MTHQLQALLKISAAEDLVSTVQGCMDHNRECQRLFYDKYFGFALKVAYRYVGDYSTATGLTNEVMLRIFHSFSGFGAYARLSLEYGIKRWIKDRLIHAAVKWVNSRVGDVLAAMDLAKDYADINAPTAAEDLADAKLSPTLMIRLLSLPASHRLIFNLNVIDGFSAAEAARLCDMRLAVVMRYLSEAHSMLRNNNLHE
ncbi:MAG TPA: hypothetical protein VGM89_20425 [Puia sp.]|jgi:RNA polymerase sigma-70 factor (ECF subfamily)